MQKYRTLKELADAYCEAAEALQAEMARLHKVLQGLLKTDNIEKAVKELQRQNKHLKKENKKLNTIVWKLKQGIEVTE